MHPLRVPMHTLQDFAVADSVVTALAQSYGRIDAIIGHLSCGARAVYLGRLLCAPILATFHGDDANFELTGEVLAPTTRACARRRRPLPRGVRKSRGPVAGVRHAA